MINLDEIVENADWIKWRGGDGEESKRMTPPPKENNNDNGKDKRKEKG